MKRLFFILGLAVSIGLSAQITELTHNTYGSQVKDRENTNFGNLQDSLDAVAAALGGASGSYDTTYLYGTKLDGMSDSILVNNTMLQDSLKMFNIESFGATANDAVDDTDAIHAAMAAAANGGVVLIPEGTFLCNITITNVVGFQMRGTGKKSILKTFNDTDPVIILTSTSVQTRGGAIRDLTLDGNDLSKGLYITATTPWVVTEYLIENIYIDECIEGIEILTTSSNEVYNNTFSSINIWNTPDAVDPARNYGIHTDGGVYNVWDKIHMEQIGSYSYAISDEAVNSRWLNVSVDGIIASIGGYASWTNVAIENIYGTVPPLAYAFWLHGDKSSLANLTLAVIPNSKADAGLRCTGVDLFIYGVHTLGLHDATPIDYPIVLVAGSSGTLINQSGGNYNITQYIPAESRNKWFLKNLEGVGPHSDIEISAALTDGAPTDAELDAAIALTPATAGAGFKVTIKDSDGSELLYAIESNGTNWQYTVLVIAL